jgi:hypothetical protein
VSVSDRLHPSQLTWFHPTWRREEIEDYSSLSTKEALFRVRLAPLRPLGRPAGRMFSIIIRDTLRSMNAALCSASSRAPRLLSAHHRCSFVLCFALLHIYCPSIDAASCSTLAATPMDTALCSALAAAPASLPARTRGPLCPKGPPPPMPLVAPAHGTLTTYTCNICVWTL